jgi:hypothetical protein
MAQEEIDEGLARVENQQRANLVFRESEKVTQRAI